MTDRVNHETVERLADTLDGHSKIINVTGGYPVDDPTMTGEAAVTLRALLAERDTLEAELTYAKQIIIDALAETQKLRAETDALWRARRTGKAPMVDTVFGVPLESIWEEIIALAEQEKTDG